MSIELVSVAQVGTLIIASCSVVGLMMGIHICRLGKNIKHMNMCGHCFTITQFSRETSAADTESQQTGTDLPPTQTIRFSRDN